MVAEGRRQRAYIKATSDQEQAADVPRPVDVPDAEMPGNARWFSPAFGMRTFADLFTNRQLLALTTFSDLVNEAREKVAEDAGAAGLSSDEGRLYGGAVASIPRVRR